MPVSRRALLGGVGIMGLSTFAAACEQGRRAVASATSGTQLVDLESSGASAESTREGVREVSSAPKSADNETPDVAHDDDEHDDDDTATDYAPDVVFRLRTGISGNGLLDTGYRDSYYPCMDLRTAALAIRSSSALAFLPNSRSAISALGLFFKSFGSFRFFLGA